MLCRKKHYALEGKGCVPVYLNVYDIASVNDYAHWLGLGAYHTGVQVLGVEYAFGAHEQSTTGVFEGEPKQCEGGFTFRKSILMGWTELCSKAEVKTLLDELSNEFKGNAYNLITKNCNHFSNHLCIRLTGNPIPAWINRLARLGLVCNCVIPASVSVPKIGHGKLQGNTDELGDGNEENKKLCEKKGSNPPSSVSSSSSSSSSDVRGRNNQRKRRAALLMNSSSPSAAPTA